MEGREDVWTAAGIAWPVAAAAVSTPARRLVICCDCGQLRPHAGHGRCRTCASRRRRAAARRLCPGCGRLALLRAETGHCGWCDYTRRRGTGRQPRRCVDCGELRLLVSRGRCERCDRRRPDWPVEYAARLADRLPQPPGWLPAFAAHLATTASPSHAVLVLRRLGTLLTEGGPATPTALLGRASRPGRGVGSLARALEAFLVDHGLALPLDTREERARQARARRAGTKPRADSTLEINLAAVRDLALFLTHTRPHLDGWAMVAAGDIEAFLTGRAPSYRARTLHPLRAFFRFARSRRLLVADPTRTLAANSNPGFAGRVIAVDRQRSLLRRWSSNPTGQHPHEAFIGLMALLHGASSTELRALKVDDIEPTARTIGGP